MLIIQGMLVTDGGNTEEEYSKQRCAKVAIERMPVVG